MSDKANNWLERVRASKAFSQAKTRAQQVLNDQGELRDLVQQASAKARQGEGPLANVWASLNAAFRMLKAYTQGRYRQIPMSTLLMLVAALLYFVMPLDAVPDVLLGLGLLDDAALLAWALRSMGGELDKFKQWESAQPTEADPPTH